MTRLLVIDCQGTELHRHTVYVGRQRVAAIDVEGVITDLGALSELRNQPYVFAIKFNLKLVDTGVFLLRHNHGIH